MFSKKYITYKTWGSDDKKIINCFLNKPISYYKDELGDDDRFLKFVFATEENAYISDETLCKDIKSNCVFFRPNGLFPINVKFFIDGEDKPIKELIIRNPLASTVKDFKEKIRKKLYGEDLNLDEIKVKYGEEKELNEDDYIFSYKEGEYFEINVIIPKDIENNYLYKISFNDEESEKRLNVKWTVSDLLKSDKKYKSPNERQKIVVKHQGKVLPDNKLLCELIPRAISIELQDPTYQFQFKDHDPISVPIPDDTGYIEAIDIVKKYIEDIKEKENERIEFQIKDFIFQYDTKFGPDFPQENPIVINVQNPEYYWTVKETEDDDGIEREFDFPEEFTISDAIKKIENKFNYKCSVKILMKPGRGKFKRLIPLKNDINAYNDLYNNISIQVYVLKCPLKFKFAIDSKEFEKEFDNNDKVSLITKHLRLKDNKLSFSDSSDDDAELNDRLEFEYKGKTISSTSTFGSLNYQPYEEDKIKVKLLSNKQDNNCFIDDNDEKMHIIVDRIGEGATSITYKIFDIANERTMCKKVLKYGKNKTIKDLQNSVKEFQFLITVHHPCICGAYGINISEPIKTDLNQEITTVALFLEFLEYDLSDCLTKKLLNNSMKARIVVEICHGMFHVHKLNCIHRDLKIDNIMLDSKFNAKLVDFGYSYINESLFGSESFSRTSMSKGVGTIDFMSPEMLNEEDYDYKTDVYSFGIVLYYIFVGSKPDYKMKDKMLGKPIKLPKPSNSISQFCLDLIKKCTQANPKDRPSFEVILNELRKNSYNLADGVDKSFVAKRDNELLSFK